MSHIWDSYSSFATFLDNSNWAGVGESILIPTIPLSLYIRFKHRQLHRQHRQLHEELMQEVRLNRQHHPAHTSESDSAPNASDPRNGHHR
jgi:hypothetical protein